MVLLSPENVECGRIPAGSRSKRPGTPKTGGKPAVKTEHGLCCERDVSALVRIHDSKATLGKLRWLIVCPLSASNCRKRSCSLDDNADTVNDPCDRQECLDAQDDR
jgi:hypothetical protein